MGRSQAAHHIDAREAAKITRALDLAGVTQSALAEEIGVSRQAVNNVLLGKTSSKRIAEMIRKVVKGWESPATPAREE